MRARTWRPRRCALAPAAPVSSHRWGRRLHGVRCCAGAASSTCWLLSPNYPSLAVQRVERVRPGGTTSGVEQPAEQTQRIHSAHHQQQTGGDDVRRVPSCSSSSCRIARPTRLRACARTARLNMESPRLHGLAAQVGVDAGKDFIVSHLIVDNSNQENCYADTSGFTPIDPPVQLGTLDSVNASRLARKDLYSWADVRDGNTIGARKFLTPHAYKWRRLVVSKPDDLVVTPNPLMSPDEYVRQMRDVAQRQQEFFANPARKVQVSLWADGPKSTLPPGHWQELATTLAARRKGYDLDTAVKLLLLTSVGTYEAGVACWHNKVVYHSVRPGGFTLPCSS